MSGDMAYITCYFLDRTFHKKNPFFALNTMFYKGFRLNAVLHL